MPPPVFDRFVVVDWSASSTPKLGRDSIWIAESGRDRAAVPPRNLATRREAVEHLIATSAASDDRVLLAVDFSLGYPRGTSDAFGLREDTGREIAPWDAMWRHLSASIVDDDDNRNNRFDVASALARRAGDRPGPFWGCPPTQATRWLTSTKVAPDPFPTWRLTEEALRRRGRRPFSSWQLLGAGAVGGQTLVGIAALSTLSERLTAGGRSVHIWPFTTGLGPPRVDHGSVTVVEAWPSMIDHRPAEQAGAVRDEAQVSTLADVLVEADRRGTLGDWFSPELTREEAEIVVSEEGWTLGA